MTESKHNTESFERVTGHSFFANNSFRNFLLSSIYLDQSTVIY